MPKKHKKLPPIKFKPKALKLFWYWINERHRIYEARKAKKDFPWTKDKILREFKFTNVFRQLDRVTQAWVDRYVTILGHSKKLEDEDILFQCAMFRLFNWPETYDALYYGMKKWNKKKAIEILNQRQKEGKQIFTGAYIIPNAGRTTPKVQVICEALDFLWTKRRKMVQRIRRKKTMQRAVKVLQDVPTIGPFIAYEIACDLRFTRILADAKDTLAWANPGPGAQRGIHRLMTGDRRWPKGKPRPNYIWAMRCLLKMAPRSIGAHVKKCEWPFEMREIEHSLCEFDKYMRVKKKEGRPRSKYTYVDVPF